MGRTFSISGVVLALSLFGVAAASAHGGGLDAHGCHHDRVEGGYHCHRGPLAGRVFADADAARRAERLEALLATVPEHTLRFGGNAPLAVLDGDTLEVTRGAGGHRIRLQGIDAPEMEQSCTAEGHTYPCGVRAREELIRLIREGDGITCEAAGFDGYGRLLGVCHDGHGRDLNAAMVEAGWALAYRQYSHGYLDAEERARKAGKGLWAGTFTAPWEWRRGR